ncbi:hypothetical protein JTB14_031924 [Gonioctena quinquepunctata]|nr:hypothetical protein JTB14_031924 [Gonioctena quinquepunctata]
MVSIPEDSSNENTPVRDEMVQTAIKFLENPNVINTPIAQKQKFLQRKGLTDQEIQVACEKSGAYARHEEQNRLPPPLPLTPSFASNQLYRNQVQLSVFDRLRDIVHNIAIFSIVAYVIHKFYERYIAPFLFGKKKKSVEESIEDLEKNVKSSVDELKGDLQSVKVEVERISQSNENNTSRQLTELKSEITSVKGLLLGRKQFPSVANIPVVPPSIPAWQMSSVSPDNNDEGDGEVRKEDLLEELGSGSGSSEQEHGMKTSESSLEIITHDDHY